MRLYGQMGIQKGTDSAVRWLNKKAWIPLTIGPLTSWPVGPLFHHTNSLHPQTVSFPSAFSLFSRPLRHSPASVDTKDSCPPPALLQRRYPSWRYPTRWCRQPIGDERPLPATPRDGWRSPVIVGTCTTMAKAVTLQAGPPFCKFQKQ